MTSLIIDWNRKHFYRIYVMNAWKTFPTEYTHVHLENVSTSLSYVRSQKVNVTTKCYLVSDLLLHQVDLQQPMIITGVSTQGRNGYNQWVTSYTLNYASDASQSFTDVATTFAANADQNTKVTHALPDGGVCARYVRLTARSWYRWISMRWELYGCNMRAGELHRPTYSYFISVPRHVFLKSDFLHKKVTSFVCLNSLR